VISVINYAGFAIYGYYDFLNLFTVINI